MNYNTKYTQKTKATFSCLQWHAAWEQRGLILVLVLNKFVTYLLRHLQPGTHMGRNKHDKNKKRKNAEKRDLC